jgi:hypothetical protein
MPQVTFLHGIGNKPEPVELLEQWRMALLVDDRCRFVQSSSVDTDNPGIGRELQRELNGASGPRVSCRSPTRASTRTSP